MIGVILYLENRYNRYHSLLQLILRVCKCTVGSSGTAPLLTKVSAHAGLVLAVGLRLQDAHIQCTLTRNIKLMHVTMSDNNIIIKMISLNRCGEVESVN